MKKLVALSLAAILALSMVACGGKKPEETTAPETTAASAETTAAAEETTAPAEETTAAAGEYTGEAMEISFAHNLAVDSTLDKACNKFAELVAEKSGGKIKITVYPAAQLGNERDMIEGIQMGTIDMVLCTTAYLSNIQPEFSVLDLPFVFDDIDHVKACVNGEVGAALTEKLSAGQNMKVISYWNSGFRDMITAKTQLKSLADFNGLQIRAPEVNVYIKMFEALGASPTPIAFGDVYTSIQTGVVEGVEVSAVQIYTMKFYEVAKNYTKTNHIYTTIAPVCMNDFWSKLDASAQAIIDEAMAEVAEWEWPAYEEDQTTALQAMVDAGVTVFDIDRDELRGACADVNKTLAAEANASDLLEKIDAAR